MKFKIGQRVRMVRTENYGVVTALLDNGLVEVRLEEGKGHLSFPSEILEAAAPEKVVSKAPALPSKVFQGADAGAEQGTKKQGSDEQGPGVRLAFDPQLDNEANPVAYEAYLLNGTPHKIIYELKVMTHGDRRWSKAGTLEAYGKKRLEAIDYRWLNEKLSCELDVRAVLTGGTGPRHFQKVNLKAQQFFQHLQDVPELYRDAHLYTVFPSLNSTRTAPATAPSKGPSLKALTAAAIKAKPKVDTSKRKVETNLKEKLEFEEFIDLHLPALVEDPEKVAKHEVLQLQLKAFDDYIDRALRLGVDNVFIIHGIGSGSLKRAIHSRLHRIKFIRKFTNEFHPKYGYGATEVIFD